MDILRIEEARWEELYSLDIYGLQIAQVNEGSGSLEDPMMTFLREVLTAYPCAAHMSRDPWDDDPYETFSASFAKDRFVLTPVGVYCHVTLFAEHDRAYGAYFPRFLPDDLSVLNDGGDPLIEYLLILDQPMLYVNVDEEADSGLRELFAHPPAASDHFDSDWFRAATAVVPLILAGGHDESCYHAVSRSPEHFALLDGPLQRTEKAIIKSEWFQANAQYLQWSDEAYEWCLVFPCGEDGHHRRCE